MINTRRRRLDSHHLRHLKKRKHEDQTKTSKSGKGTKAADCTDASSKFIDPTSGNYALSAELVESLQDLYSNTSFELSKISGSTSQDIIDAVNRIEYDLSTLLEKIKAENTVDYNDVTHIGNCIFCILNMFRRISEGALGNDCGKKCKDLPRLEIDETKLVPKLQCEQTSKSGKGAKGTKF